MTSSVDPIGSSSQDQESAILSQLRQYGIKPTGNYATDLAALKAAQSGQTSNTQKTQQTNNENRKAEFEAEVQSYMSSHPGISENEAKEAVKAQHSNQNSQLTRQIPTQNIWE